VQQFIPAGFVLVIVLRHVVRQVRHERSSCQPQVAGMIRWGDNHREILTLYLKN
jgi:hypothetical protein